MDAATEDRNLSFGDILLSQSVVSNSSSFHIVLFVFVLHLPPFCVFCSSSFCFKWLVYADYDPYAVAGVCNDHGKTYALYAITVHRRNLNSEEMWKTYRRYSDFHDFHMRITEQVIRFVTFVYFKIVSWFSILFRVVLSMLRYWSKLMKENKVRISVWVT